MYFESFPKLTYEIAGKTYLLSDITRNVRVKKELLSNITLYDTYDIVDGETPEIIAEKIYGDAQYHWIVMLTNLSYDYRSDFPLTYDELEQYITEKYQGTENDVHHYETSLGYIVEQDYLEDVGGVSRPPVAVTNYQYEERINEQKRRIKLISPELLDEVIKNFRDLMNG